MMFVKSMGDMSKFKNKIGHLYTVEYSAIQDDFHVDVLSRVLGYNCSNAKKRNSTDYQILGIFENVDEAIEFSKEFRKTQQAGDGDHRSQVVSLSDVSYSD